MYTDSTEIDNISKAYVSMNEGVLDAGMRVGLDLVGLIPGVGVGEAADIANGILSLNDFRKSKNALDLIAAAVSFCALIPACDALKPIRYLKYFPAAKMEKTLTKIVQHRQLIRAGLRKLKPILAGDVDEIKTSSANSVGASDIPDDLKKRAADLRNKDMKSVYSDDGSSKSTKGKKAKSVNIAKTFQYIIKNFKPEIDVMFTELDSMLDSDSKLAKALGIVKSMRGRFG
jgi:hypothetical protein